MGEQEIIMDSLDELARLISSMPEDAMVTVTFGEEDTDGKKECI